MAAEGEQVMVSKQELLKLPRDKLEDIALAYGVKIPAGCDDVSAAHHVIIPLSLMHRLDTR